MSSRLWMVLVMLLVFPISCKEPAKESKKAPSEDATPTVTPQSERPSVDEEDDEDEDDDDEDDCKNKKDKDEDEDEEEDDDLGLRLTGRSIKKEVTNTADKEKSKKKKKKKKSSRNKSKKKANLAAATRGFGLVSTDPNYKDDVRSIFSDKCESCHSGSDDYALDTYSNAYKIRDKIKTAVADGEMPPKNKAPLTSLEKTTIKDWVTAGALESSSSTSDDDDEDEDDEDDDSKDDCDDDSSSSAAAADWDDLLKKKEVEKCNDKDKIFDRLSETCHKAKIASFDCSRSGVVGKFKELSINVEKQYDEFIDDGYKIDQCGEYEKEPIVLFYKKVEEKNELKLLIKKLCKKGSAACDN